MQSLKLVLGLAAAFGVATGCAEDALRQKSCDPGTEGCACGVDGECDTGLRCVERGDEDRCVPVADTAEGAGGSAGSESSGERPPPGAGASAGGSSTGSAPSASGDAAPEADAGSSGTSTGSGGSAQASGGATSSGGSKASGGSPSGGSGGSHTGGTGGTSDSSGGHPASGGAPAAGGAPVASGGAAGSEGTRPGLSDGCLSCTMEQCGAVAKQCKNDEICSGCIAGKGKGGDCSFFDSLYGALLMCVCSVPECVESCGPSCPRR